MSKMSTRTQYAVLEYVPAYKTIPVLLQIAIASLLYNYTVLSEYAAMDENWLNFHQIYVYTHTFLYRFVLISYILTRFVCV